MSVVGDLWDYALPPPYSAKAVKEEGDTIQGIKTVLCAQFVCFPFSLVATRLCKIVR